MEYQKDNKKTDMYNPKNRDSNASVTSNNSLLHKPIQNEHILTYEYINKKTEKLVTALYMVTDCMDTDDAIKGNIRLRGVELLSDMYKLETALPVDKRNHVPITLSHIHEVLSLIEISYTIGFISEMNTSILKREILVLAHELKVIQSKDTHFTFTLDEAMFDLPTTHTNTEEYNLRKEFPAESFIRDKRTVSNMSFNTIRTSQLTTKGQNNLSTNHTNKKERTDKILYLIKDKKDLPGGEAGVSIKDISITFTNCSEKTIQRELNSLVLKGQIKKIGAKRWSRYQAL